MGRGHQNERTFSCTRSILDPVALIATEASIERCLSRGPHGSRAGNENS